jgi:DNA-binding MarR family transcriptional regulator
VSQDLASLTRQLRLLGNQAMRLAADVAAHSAAEEERGVFQGLERDSDVWLLVAEDIYRERQRRRDFFSDDLFGEPAWDMLLDLYIAEKRNRRVSVTAACLGANAPGTTALRWLQQLEERGLAVRDADPKDARRSFVRLSEEGYARMTDYFWSTRGTLLRARGLDRVAGTIASGAVPPDTIPLGTLASALVGEADRSKTQRTIGAPGSRPCAA